MQLFGVVIGYLSVSRLNISYDRYWEGITEIKTMHSKWACCCGALIQFDQVGNPNPELWDEPYCVYIVRLFSQLSAMAMMRLHLDNAAVLPLSNRAPPRRPPADRPPVEMVRQPAGPRPFATPLSPPACARHCPGKVTPLPP